MEFKRITFDPNLYYGKPVMKGTRIPVYCILELVAEGIPFDKIIQDHYPALTVEHIQEALLLATTLLKDEAVCLPYPEQ
ncbi:MAG: DUF433 domain-containing protein [Planctomycetota bacterium]|nr:MAG: DUF433 domain-containing protein [Planctomycetota bacterium]